jgi:hypothetical protein
MASNFLRVAVSVAVFSCTQGFGFASSPTSLQDLRLRSAPLRASSVVGLHLRGGGPFQMMNKLFGFEEKKPMAIPKIIIAGAMTCSRTTH